jgi:cytochrome c oxidase cbb3-type subunit 3
MILLVSVALAGCKDGSAEELPVWTPQDHDNQGAPSPGQVDIKAPRPGMPDLAEHGISDVILATWKQNCTPCHGLIGRGDGPQGRMLRPPDLTSPEYHKRAIDSEMQYTIKKGRGRMPAFGHLPDDTVKGLVNLVRMLNPERTKPEAAGTGGVTEAEAASESPPSPHQAVDPAR